MPPRPSPLNASVVERLRDLTRSPLPTTRPVGRPADRGTSASPSAQSAVAASALLGCECETPWGPHWRIDCPAADLLPALSSDLQDCQRREPPPSSDEEPHPELRQLNDRLTTGVLFLDLETCGFAGSMIFLVGLIRPAAAGLMLTQLLARNYAEEKAILYSLWQLAAGCPMLVTFNGKSFDWPCVHDRSTLHHLGRDPRFAPAASTDGLSAPSAPLGTLDRHTRRPEPLHVDLLHHSRRQWRERLPNCRLQTLEQHLCGRFRVADIAGADIPAAYHHFVQSGQTGPMHSILHHNALDLLTLVQVAVRLCRADRLPGVTDGPRTRAPRGKSRTSSGD